MGNQTDRRPTSARDEDLLTGLGSLHVEAEVVAELVGADGLSLRPVGGVELTGLEPAAFALPAQTLSQLSYSPSELKIRRVVYRRSL